MNANSDTRSPESPLRAAYGPKAAPLLLLGSLLLFVVALKMIGLSSTLAGAETARELVRTASNPFVGLFIGMLATAIVQSSSLVTSLIVTVGGAVILGQDASMADKVAVAVPMIMGANVGTSVTSTLVALGHIASRTEYRKAIAAATLHDFFNLLTVIVFFPLELAFGVISKPAAMLAGWIAPGSSGGTFLAFLHKPLEPLTNWVSGTLEGGLGEAAGATVGILLGMVLVYLALRGLILSMRSLLTGSMRKRFESMLFGSPVQALGWGAMLTALVQSSSLVTSLTVPMVASGKVSLDKAFPFLMGANVGTTVTALLAGFATTGNVQVALSIALTHVLFNLIGVALFFPLKRIQEIPLKMARNLGKATMHNRLVGVLYIGITFFLVPFCLILASRAMDVTDRQESAPQAVEYQLPGQDQVD